MTTVRAHAHPNIALVKYWGKQDAKANLPAVPSLSITLDRLKSTTEVSEAPTDCFVLDDVELSGADKDTKLARFLNHLRQTRQIPPLRIVSNNNFPTAAGLASSASGFAALVTAINSLCELDLTAVQLSALARVGSASAARSILGGFVGLTQPAYEAEQIKAANHWPLQVVVAITATEKKSVSSTNGMEISAKTSPFYQSWVASSTDNYVRAKQAVLDRNFDQLAEVSEHSCLKMHAVMQSSIPPLMYWNPASVACMQRVAELRRDGHPVFFTMDAGPQVKAVCTEASVATVKKALTNVPGVVQVEQVALGPAATVIRS